MNKTGLCAWAFAAQSSFCIFCIEGQNIYVGDIMFYNQNKRAVRLIRSSPRFYFILTIISLLRSLLMTASILSAAAVVLLLRAGARLLDIVLLTVLSLGFAYFYFMLRVLSCLAAQGLQSSVKLRISPLLLIKKTSLLLTARLVSMLLKLFYLAVSALPVGLVLSLYFLMKSQGLIFRQSLPVIISSTIIFAYLGIRLLLLANLSLSLVDDIIISEKCSPLSAVRLSRRVTDGALRELLFARIAFLPLEILSLIPFLSAFAEGYHRLSTAGSYTGLKKREPRAVLLCPCTQSTKRYK